MNEMFGFSQAHYDLTVSVASRWLDKDVGWSILDRNIRWFLSLWFFLKANLSKK